MGERQHRLGIACRIGLADREPRRERERGRPLQPRLDALRLRGRVGGRDAVLIDEGDRRLAARLGRVDTEQGRRERFEREQRKVERDPEHEGSPGKATARKAT